MKKIHFIAIGGAAMHNLAIALKKKGYQVSGSDDEIFEPSRSRLDKHGLLPEKKGWYPENITAEIDAVILGMHALPDNPELSKAQSLGLKIYSYPEFLYQQTANKKRIVIAGSHGKTTITAMVIHIFKACGIKTDFMVGSQLEGFDTMVELNDDSEFAVFEGDEYLSSPLDRRPKFMHYKPHVALISGIAWDHINVFPTFDTYVEQFRLLLKEIQPGGTLVYFEGDETLAQIANDSTSEIKCVAYPTHANLQENGLTSLLTSSGEKVPIKVFGPHNLQNLNGARLVCQAAGIKDKDFYQAISTFSGTQKRLQVIAEHNDLIAYLDFAHSPSKVKATVEAVRAKYPGRHITAIFELHTFSSLNKGFIPHYKHSMLPADKAVVFFNPEVVAAKKLEAFTTEFVSESFDQPGLMVLTSPHELEEKIKQSVTETDVLLLMSSGNFGGIDIKKLLAQP